MKKIGVVGLGNMGRGMALSLKKAGFEVLGYDPSSEACSRLQKEKIQIAKSIKALAQSVDALVLSLPVSDIVEAVVFNEDGLLAGAKAGLLIIDTSTADPKSTRKVAQALAEKGMRFIDAPVSGGPKGATTGSLTMVLGGSVEDIAKAEPILAAMSTKRVHVGPVSAGHVTKLLNNLLCSTHLLIAAEAVRIAESAGLDPQKIFDGINAGSGRSGVTEVNYPTWIFNGKYDSGFTMKLMRKDVALATGLLQDLGVVAPLATEAGRLWVDSGQSIDDQADFNRIVEFIQA